MTEARHTALARFAEPLFAREPELWQKRRAFGETLRPGLQMTAYEGALVAWLLKLHGARHVLEIGSFVGVSALWLASALPEDGSVTSIERAQDYAVHAQDTMRMAAESRVTIMQADAADFLRDTTRIFDAVFLDGEKKTYPEMLEAALPRLREGAMIVADNTLLFGALLGEEPRARASDVARTGMERFHRMLAEDARFDSMLLPTGEGLSVAVYKG